MIKIRLSRGGAKNQPLYRIVAIEKRRKGIGKNLEILGYYDPKKKSHKLNKENYNKWVANGAQVSTTVKKLIEK